MTSAAALRSDSPPRGVWGVAEIGFAAEKGGPARLRHLYQRNPLRVLFPTPAPADSPVAALVTTSGGLVAGDRLDVTVTAGAGCALVVTAQAAEKVYRSTGADCRLSVLLRAEEGAFLEYLPQETILFEGARMRRLTGIERQAGARVMAGEFLVFGRAARGEKMRTGLVRDAWEVRRDGRLCWADALHMDGDLAALLADPACFDGAAACATLLYSGEDAGDWLDCVREALVLPRSGATLVNGQLVVRWLAPDAREVRREFGLVWALLRHRAAGLPEALPRLWHV